MRIGGTTIRRIGLGCVRIPQPGGASLEIKVRAYPLGFDIDELFPFPQAPKIKARRAGGVVERDSQERVVWDVDERDKGYRAAYDRVARVRKACQFHSAVIVGDGPGEMRFETDVSSGSAEAYLALWDELVAAGFTEGDLLVVVLKAKEISLMTDKAMEAALADFSRAGDCPPDAKTGDR